MTYQRKIFLGVLWGATILCMIGVVGAAWWQHAGANDDLANSPLQPLFDAPHFSLVDQHGKAVSDADLRGHVWVATLFFTNCPGVCPMMTSRLLQMQLAVPDRNVRIVSFSIDPKNDTPEKLEAYAQRLGADESRWSFLTGTSDAMSTAARGLNLGVEPAHDDVPITHSSKVLLIDEKNRVRGIYSGTEDESMQKLASDAKLLIAEHGS